MRRHPYGTRSVVRSATTNEPIGYLVHEGPHRFSAHSDTAGSLGEFTMVRRAVEALLTAHEAFLSELASDS